MKVDAFDFVLPPERIAQQPLRPRDAARLLAVGATSLTHLHIRDLPSLFRPGDLLVFNDTEVIPARLFGRRAGKAGSAGIEVTLHKRAAPGRWYAFARPARRLKVGQAIAFAAELAATVAEVCQGGEVVLDFSCDDGSLLAALHRFGRMPLPPYIRRKPLAASEMETASDLVAACDHRDYQTMFAARPGAVAAPTAGLHFTPALLDALAAARIGWTMLTLHVGAGTFLPVKSETTEGHVMHAEWGEIDAATATVINRTRADGGRIAAIGTTSLRLLETAATGGGVVSPFAGETDLFIVPGYRFRTTDLLLTNFHLPRSTLFMLVSAFAGLERMQRAYAEAIAAGYRFYSYGDACLLERCGGK